MAKIDWSYLNDILKDKKDLWVDGESEQEYEPFIINRQISKAPSGILYAHEMARLPNIPAKWNYHYYLHSIRKGTKYDGKKVPIERTDDIKLVSEYYKYNHTLAKQALSILTKEQLDEIRIKTDKGGKQ
jgi:hypothetical protein